MTGGRRRAELSAMTSPGRLRISLELEPGREPVSGRVYDDTGRERPFSGWLGLLAGLHELRREGDILGASLAPAAAYPNPSCDGSTPGDLCI